MNDAKKEWRVRNAAHLAEYQRQWRSRNPEYIKNYQRKWVKENRDKVLAYQKSRVHQKYSKELYAATRDSRLRAARKYKIKHEYGLSGEQYLELLNAQNNRCKICSREFCEKYIPQIDHDHETNEIRGLLCIVCNTCLRAIDKDRTWGEKALAYLEKRL